MKRVVVVAAAALAVAFASVITAAPAQARACPPASIGGATVAVIKVAGRAVPIKSITFRNGGVLHPPATNQAAGISARNAPLGARRGSTVITWHVRYGKGCPGTLNSLTTLPIGSTFTVGKVGKTPKTYRIASRETVAQGVLKRSWFRHTGRHRLVLITCADLRGGDFRRTMTIIATPVPAGTPLTPAPTEPTAPTKPTATPAVAAKPVPVTVVPSRLPPTM